LIGDYGDGRADFPWNTLLHHELELIGSNASAGAWTRAVELAVTGKLPLERLISRRLPMASGVECVELVRRSRDLVKVVMEGSL
jgi:threonine dehydrogenase-like Zn-dependent dehydrogenase